MACKIHIGSIIKHAVEAKGISVIDFADSINCTQRNAYKIFNKSSLDSDLLIKISNVLGENLFVHYLTDQEIMELKIKKDKEAEVISSMKELIATVRYLKTLEKRKHNKNQNDE